MGTEDSGWVFDSLVGFLKGPIWSSPLLTFVEERSIIFESEMEDNKEYFEAYQEYKNLVDLLLGSYMEDMGITPEQFEHACTVNKQTKIPVQFQQSLFEQIWAANEYLVFKRMMIQKNLELQLQALSMIEQKFGLTPASLTCGPDAHFPQEELVMDELLSKQSQEEDPTEETEEDLKKEHQRLATKYESEKAALKEALDISTNSLHSFSDVREGPEDCQATGDPWDDDLIPELLKRPSPLPSISNLCDYGHGEAAQQIVEKTPIEPENHEEMRKREEYLKERRDQLVALKKQARCQYLETVKKRPSTARSIAEATMKGESNLEHSTASDPSIIQVRKALAARLKAEVVDP
ncbi:cilia- and flagella-associated protein 36 [Fopius arisanus]|uniref:Cilia- and flagella-associated protein 36 n=1 Tax=Fopius arisanus TaxID=64838 RepID=A0A0C9QJD1_9HYME|nr:PREDICTED: cilia- and flagella-associated protein 36 [Fopius arisanus]